MPKPCNCPKGMKYHAVNCPVAPNEPRGPAQYVEPDAFIRFARLAHQDAGVPWHEPDACVMCKQPRAAHHSRHSADADRRNRCPSPVST